MHSLRSTAIAVLLLVSVLLLIAPGMNGCVPERFGVNDYAYAGYASGYGREFYVAPKGKDSNPGTRRMPFATLGKARDAVRKLIKTVGIPKKGIIIWIRGGVYDLAASLAFGKTDSGADGRRIVYSAYPGENVRITGAASLDWRNFSLVKPSSPVWKRLDERAYGKVYQADLSKRGTADFGIFSERGYSSGGISPLELYFNAKRMQLSRWPDVGETGSDNVTGGFALTTAGVSKNRFAYAGERPSRWSGSADIWAHGMWGNMWADNTVKIAGIDTLSRIISLKGEMKYGIRKNAPYIVENLLEEITAPGEWYLDRKSGMLYFWPPGPIRGSEIKVSMLNNIIDTGKASFIDINNVTLEMCRGTAVKIGEGASFAVMGCNIRNTGGCGAEVCGTGSGLDHCRIYDIGTTGVELSGGNRAGLTPGRNYVSNCEISGYGYWVWMYQPGVRIRGAGNIVRNNNIHDSPHAAVIFSGNNHEIEYNDIHDVCKCTDDAGAVYSGRNWGFRGNCINFNFIHDVRSCADSMGQTGYGVNGIYLDDCISGTSVFGNVIYEISGKGIVIGGGRDNTVSNNIVARCGTGIYADSRGPAWITSGNTDWNLLKKLSAEGIKYRAEPWASAYPKLAAIPDDWGVVGAKGSHWLYPEGNVVSCNAGCRNAVWTRDYQNAFSWFAAMHDNYEFNTLGFADESCLDLKLGSDSPVFSIKGFNDIPFKKIGIMPADRD